MHLTHRCDFSGAAQHKGLKALQTVLSDLIVLFSVQAFIVDVPAVGQELRDDGIQVPAQPVAYCSADRADSLSGTACM